MHDPIRDEATRLVQRLGQGDERAASELLPLVYDELRRIASGYLRREREGHTLEPTALVHEAWAKLVRQEDARVDDAAHFRALASNAMRRVLVDHARSRAASKRAAEGERVTLAGVGRAEEEEEGFDVLGLDAALEKLARVSERQARVVELRFFGGLEIEDAARALGVSARTVVGDWRVARAWLARELDGD